MSLFGKSERCEREGCGHALSDHVSDNVMHQGEWIAVHRCIACEHGGGPCVDSSAVFAAEGSAGG